MKTASPRCIQGSLPCPDQLDGTLSPKLIQTFVEPVPAEVGGTLSESRAAVVRRLMVVARTRISQASEANC